MKSPLTISPETANDLSRPSEGNITPRSSSACGAFAAQATPGIAGCENADRAEGRADDIHDEQCTPYSFPAGKKARPRRFLREAGVAGQPKVEVELYRPNKGWDEQPVQQEAAPCSAISRG